MVAANEFLHFVQVAGENSVFRKGKLAPDIGDFLSTSKFSLGKSGDVTTPGPVTHISLELEEHSVTFIL